MLNTLARSKNIKKLSLILKKISLRFISGNKYFSMGIYIRGIDFQGFTLKLALLCLTHYMPMFDSYSAWKTVFPGGIEKELGVKWVNNLVTNESWKTISKIDQGSSIKYVHKICRKTDISKPSCPWYERVRIRGVEILVFRKILRTYLMGDPYCRMNQWERWVKLSSVNFNVNKIK